MHYQKITILFEYILHFRISLRFRVSFDSSLYFALTARLTFFLLSVFETENSNFSLRNHKGMHLNRNFLILMRDTQRKYT